MPGTSNGCAWLGPARKLREAASINASIAAVTSRTSLNATLDNPNVLPAALHAYMTI
jgi:hypothetical protein